MSDTDSNPFRLWRAQLGPDVTQLDVASRVGCSAALVSAWEHALCAPAVPLQSKVAEVYRKSPLEVLEAVRWIWAHRPERRRYHSR